SQAALAIERAQFAEAARQAQVLQETEKLQGALLNSISHDLRTPLVSITGTLSSLQEDAVQFDAATRQSMIETAYAEAQRLNHLVGNLLDMSRIESGAMRVRQEWCDVQDVIGSALDNLGERIHERQVSVDLPATLPMVPLDFVLIVQVLVNLLDNALKYSPPRSRIEVSAQVTALILEIKVADRGIGIPSEDLTRVFDKFYRVQRPDGVKGTGLGLAICKGIIEAHRGKIQAENREGGGTIVAIQLPLRTDTETK
ncbi:MAG: ATP-binding protein, partial [Anaerolineales bacterium]|nr:ATP-binding protein [Anaerolineales bacterium]